MKILVTGGAGFIGTNLIKQLLNDNHIVYSIDNYETGYKENHIEGAVYIENELEFLNSFNENFDICFHLAALSRIQPSFQNPSETFRVNVKGTECVLEWALRNRIKKVIYSGSSSKWHDPTISPYAMYKYLGEEICKLYRKVYNMNIEICRFYNVYGPYEIVEGDYSAIIGKWRYQISNNKPVTIVGDGNQRRDFTWIGDIIDGLIKVAFSQEKHEDAWELGSGFNYSINELYEIFNERFHIDCMYVPDQPGNYRKTLRENDDTINRLKWQPTNRLREYIQSL
jgi:UDP-glucose 4-epimerase